MHNSKNLLLFLAFAFVLVFGLMLFPTPEAQAGRPSCDVTIEKVARPSDGTDFEFTCSDGLNFDCGGAAEFSLMNNQSQLVRLDDEGMEGDPDGMAAVVEQVPDGWELDDVACEVTVGNPDSLSFEFIDNGVFMVCGDESIDGLCTFTNIRLPFEIELSPLNATNVIVTEHTVTATIDFLEEPQENILVDFEVVSGPNTGQSSAPDNGECTPNDDCTTDANGQVSWTYTGSNDTGTDTIIASFFDENTQMERESNAVEKIWVLPPRNIPTLSEWGLIAMVGLLAIIGIMTLRRMKASA